MGGCKKGVEKPSEGPSLTKPANPDAVAGGVPVLVGAGDIAIALISLALRRPPNLLSQFPAVVFTVGDNAYKAVPMSNSIIATTRPGAA